MITIRSFGCFFRQGATIFRDASKGRYSEESTAVDELRKEMFATDSKRSDDKSNLMRDRKAVEKDVRRAMTNYCLVAG